MSCIAQGLDSLPSRPVYEETSWVVFAVQVSPWYMHYMQEEHFQ